MVSDNSAYRRETRSASSELEWVLQIPHHELLSPEQKGGTHSESCLKTDQQCALYTRTALTSDHTHTAIEDKRGGQGIDVT